MGVLSWFERAVDQVLDRRVANHEGVAHANFTDLDPDADLVVTARLAPGQTGSLRLRATPGHDSTDASDRQMPDWERTVEGVVLEAELGPARRYQGGQIVVAADVTVSGATASADQSTQSSTSSDPASPEGTANLAQLTLVVSQIASRSGSAEASRERTAGSHPGETYSVESRFAETRTARLSIVVTL